VLLRIWTTSTAANVCLRQHVHPVDSADWITTGRSVQDSAKQGIVPGLGAQQIVLDTEELVSALNEHVS
jgi:hypothetical protein